MLNKNVVTFIGCDAEYEEAEVVLFGVPFDSTTSYRPGARFASQAVRSESYGLETYSPYLDKDLEDGYFFDSGDLELAIGNSNKVLHAITERVDQILEDDKIPFMIGGERLVTLGAIRGIHKKYDDFHIIHFGAHAALRENYLGVELSHASVIRRCWDLVGDGKIHQFGIRSGSREEFKWQRKHIDFHPFFFQGLHQTVKKLEGKHVYLTVELDVLDPSIFPGTGTPEAGGVTFLDLLEALHIVLENCNIVGCDVTELAPTLDQSGASTAVACKVIREMLLDLMDE